MPPPQDFGRKVQRRIRRRSRGRFFAEESWLGRIPWEWISFVIIMLMLVVYYYMLLQAQALKVKAGAEGGQEAGVERPVDSGGD